MDINGQGTWSLSQFASAGALAVRDLVWRDENIAFTEGDVSSDYAINDQQIKLTKLQGKVLGGSFIGDAQVEHWLSNPSASQAATGSKQAKSAAPNRVERKSEKKKREEVEEGVLHLRLRDFSAEEIAKTVNFTARAVGRAHPAGSVSGTLETRWKGAPRNADVGFTLDLNPSPHPSRGQLPMTGQAQGVYRAATGLLELPKFNVATPATRIQASGTLSSSSSLRVSFSTSNDALANFTTGFPATVMGSPSRDRIWRRNRISLAAVETPRRKLDGNCPYSATQLLPLKKFRGMSS